MNGLLKPGLEREGIALTWNDQSGDSCLACPVCGYDFSHIRHVYTALGNDPFEGGSAYQGTVARGVTDYRRDCLVITIDGECGHVWEIRIQQHKGCNYVKTRIMEIMEYGEERP